MARRKNNGLSFNGGDDKIVKRGFKADVNWTLEIPLESLSFDGIFETKPIITVKKETLNKKPEEINLSRKKKKKGNELI